MDDPGLEAEVLDLFTRQAVRLKDRIASAEDDQERRRLAHTLKGAARGIGAFEVASHAEALEGDPGNAALAAALGLRIGEACRFIAARKG
jgi:HPt (histidine-containing phosphotransfer) domain-containing protein